jgi:hypothetical protein
MERRLQLLLDEERYSRLSAESRESGRSIASLIREAIDTRWDADAARHQAAAQRVLDWVTPPTPGEREEDWDEIKRAIEDDIVARLPRRCRPHFWTPPFRRTCTAEIITSDNPASRSCPRSPHAGFVYKPASK